MADKFPNSGELLHGQKFFLETGIVVKYTKQNHHDKKSEAQFWGNPLTEIDSLDGHQNQVVTWIDPSAQLATKSWTQHITVNLDLPPVLQAISTVYNTQKTAATVAPITDPYGSLGTLPLAYSAGTSGGLRFTPRVSAKSSVMLMADLQFTVVEYDARNVPAVRYTFYMPKTSTRAEVLTKIATLAGAAVSTWPKFRPVSRTFTATGQEGTINLELDARHFDDWSSSNLSFSVEANKSVAFAGSVSNKTLQTPACINNGISIGTPTRTETIGVSATVNLPEITGTGAAPSFPAYTHADTTRTVAITAGVFPTAIPASSGASSIPTSGLYLLDLVSTPDSWDHNRITATVVDFANV